jgi:hypothetical protein
MIDAEFNREDYDWTPRNCDREEAGTTRCQNSPRTRLDSPVGQMLVVKTKTKKEKRLLLVYCTNKKTNM